MARTMRGCLTAWSQPECTEEHETNPSVPQHEEQANAIDGKVTADNELDLDCKPEGSDPENKPDAQKEKISNAEYAKMEPY